MAFVVQVNNGLKYYGGKKKNVVLNNLNLKVEYGEIYGLLGASGCGKTTLIKCIVGLTNLNSGELNVLGGPPNTVDSGVPGPKIGYMPQENGLIQQLSIKETIYYFCYLNDMDLERITTEYEFIYELLELPDCDRKVEDCSGGEQRRVSFAVAVTHSPELLILDEPTVGLDPLLRERIWSFLIDRIRTTNMTVLMSTHYLEEAKLANKVAFMRGGVLLAEDSPQNIIRQCKVATLENAFLFLSQKQGSEEVKATSRLSIDIPQIKVKTASKAKKARRKPNILSRSKMKALITKNYLQLVRQPLIAFIFLGACVLSFVLVFLVVDGDLKDLKIGIVDEELDTFMDCNNESLITTFQHEYKCDFYKISCRFLNAIKPDVAEKIFYSSWDDAYREARTGKLAAIIRFASNFTESYKDIFDNNQNSDEGSFENSYMEFNLDQSELQLTLFLTRKLYQIYKEFSENLMTDCGKPKNLRNSLIKLEQPVYGSLDEKWTTFIVPGLAVTWMVLFPMLTSITAFIYDRTEGVWSRVLVAGVRPLEFLFAHIIVESIIMIIELVAIIMVAIVIYGQPHVGNDFLSLTLLLLAGFYGILLGLVVSIYIDTYTECAMVGTGILCMMLFLSGTTWPIEGAPYVLQLIGKSMPFYFTAHALRNVVIKGFTITHPTVYIALLGLIGNLVGLSLLGIIGLKVRK